LRPSWFDNGVLQNKAFRRRLGVDIDGLSIASSHDSAKLLQKSGKAVASLADSGILELGLGVIHSDERHGFIDGVPYDSEENYNKATEIADRLVELCSGNIVYDHWRRDD
jgi:hypothetical protein